MAKRKILPFGEPILRQTAKPVIVFHKKLGEFVDEMIEILCSKDGGSGLAAPQVGVSKRIVVARDEHQIYELINPEIVERRGEQKGEEACLSLRGYYGNVTRAEWVKVKACNRKGERITVEGRGHLARCFQHECDHLDGVLYVDRLDDARLFKTSTEAPADASEIIALSRGGKGAIPPE